MKKVRITPRKKFSFDPCVVTPMKVETCQTNAPFVEHQKKNSLNFPLELDFLTFKDKTAYQGGFVFKITPTLYVNITKSSVTWRTFEYNILI